MTTEKPKAPTGAGRPREYDEEVMKPRTYRMTDEQAAKLDRLGGAQWLRERIDEAEEQ